MSFILDALRKLEQKRKHSSVPDLMTIHTPELPRPGKRQVWPYLVMAALLLNAGILAAVFRPWEDSKEILTEKSEIARELKAGDAETYQPGSIKKAPIKAPVFETEKKIVSADKISIRETSTDNALSSEKNKGGTGEAPEPEQVVSPEISTDDAAPAGTQAIKEAAKEDDAYSTRLGLSANEIEDLRDRIKEERALITDNIPAPVEVKSRDEDRSVEGIPDFGRLPSDIKKALPDISISGHVFSDNPVARMVNINGNIIREGEKISRDLSVDEITMSGVILNFNGVRFHMRAF